MALWAGKKPSLIVSHCTPNRDTRPSVHSALRTTGGLNPDSGGNARCKSASCRKTFCNIPIRLFLILSQPLFIGVEWPFGKVFLLIFLLKDCLKEPRSAFLPRVSHFVPKNSCPFDPMIEAVNLAHYALGIRPLATASHLWTGLEGLCHTLRVVPLIDPQDRSELRGGNSLFLHWECWTHITAKSLPRHMCIWLVSGVLNIWYALCLNCNFQTSILATLNANLFKHHCGNKRKPLRKVKQECSFIRYGLR